MQQDHSNTNTNTNIHSSTNTEESNILSTESAISKYVFGSNTAETYRLKDDPLHFAVHVNGYYAGQIIARHDNPFHDFTLYAASVAGSTQHFNRHAITESVEWMVEQVVLPFPFVFTTHPMWKRAQEVNAWDLKPGDRIHDWDTDKTFEVLSQHGDGPYHTIVTGYYSKDGVKSMMNISIRQDATVTLLTR